MRYAVRIRDRAIRRTGELLKQIEPANGANQNIGAGAHPNVETRKTAALVAGLSPHQAKQAVRVANIPAAQFEALVESENPPPGGLTTSIALLPTPRRTPPPERIPRRRYARPLANLPEVRALPITGKAQRQIRLQRIRLHPPVSGNT